MGARRNNICLIGYMGCGKTSVGRFVSDRLDMAFKDTDEMIETLEGRSIPQIFKESGEPRFRELEHELLCKLTEGDALRNTVLSTGGGIVMDKGNRPLIKDLGTVFYLRAGADTLYKRVGKGAGRPLLDTDDMYKKICDMLILRGPVYEECADHIIDTDELDIAGAAKKILEIWRTIV